MNLLAQTGIKDVSLCFISRSFNFPLPLYCPCFMFCCLNCFLLSLLSAKLHITKNKNRVNTTSKLPCKEKTGKLSTIESILHLLGMFRLDSLKDAMLLSFYRIGLTTPNKQNDERKESHAIERIDRQLSMLFPEDHDAPCGLATPEKELALQRVYVGLEGSSLR